MRSKSKVLVMLLCLVVLGTSLAGLANAKSRGAVSGVVNINTATVEQLKMIPGIGQIKAEAIVTQRNSEKFSQTEDLLKVRGVGNKLLAKISDYVTINGPTTAKYGTDE